MLARSNRVPVHVPHIKGDTTEDTQTPFIRNNRQLAIKSDFITNGLDEMEYGASLRPTFKCLKRTGREACNELENSDG